MNTLALRRAARSTRRIIDGGRGLGFGTTARWGLHQLTRPSAAHVNTSLTWVRATADLTTIVWINNYWSDAYGIDAPHLDAELIAVDGTTVTCFPVDLSADATHTIDVRTALDHCGVTMPFDGQLLLTLRDARVVPNRPVQVFAEYRRDDGECSGVHGQYGLVATPAAQVVSAMRVATGAGERTGFVVTNAYAGPGVGHSMQTTMTVHADDGRAWNATLPPLASRATAIVYADELIPELRSELDGSAAHARVQLACPSSRLATFIESGADRRLVVNHGTVDRVFDQESGIPAEWTESWPVASAFVVIDEARDTVITLPNVWGPRASDYVAIIDVYRPDGTWVQRHEELIDRNGVREVSAREVIGLTRGSAFHAEVSVRCTDRERERPHTFDILVGVRVDGHLVAEAQVGAEFYNATVPPGVRWIDIRRTRVFGRVDQTAGRRTWIFLGYPVGGGSSTGTAGTGTEPRLTLISADGRHRRETTVRLARHGCRLATIDELFPDADDVLGPQRIGQIRVRDTAARLYGYSWVEHPTAETFPLDHLIGG